MFQQLCFALLAFSKAGPVIVLCVMLLRLFKDLYKQPLAEESDLSRSNDSNKTNNSQESLEDIVLGNMLSTKKYKTVSADTDKAYF